VTGVTTLRTRLRDHTGELHARLDAGLPLMRDDVTPAAYTTFLTRMLAWLQPVEQTLSNRLPATDLQVPFVERAGWLTDDLTVLGVPLPERAPARCLPVLESPSHAVGCWYVIEGAALGGQVLSRRLRTQLGVTPERGGRYLAGSGTATPARWRDVCGALERYDGPPDDVLDGARRSFESLHAWLL